jgi:hypothetical protein
MLRDAGQAQTLVGLDALVSKLRSAL